MLKQTAVAMILANPHADEVRGFLRRDCGIILKKEEQLTLTAEQILERAKTKPVAVPAAGSVDAQVARAVDALAAQVARTNPQYVTYTAEVRRVRSVRIEERAYIEVRVSPLDYTLECVRDYINVLDDNGDIEWETRDEETQDYGGVTLRDENSLQVAVARNNIDIGPLNVAMLGGAYDCDDHVNINDSPSPEPDDAYAVSPSIVAEVMRESYALAGVTIPPELETNLATAAWVPQTPTAPEPDDDDEPEEEEEDESQR